MSPARCLICRSSDVRLRYAISRFDVMDCRTCGQVYLHPLPTPDEIRQLFESLYSTGDSSLPELKEYYGFCFEDSPENPLVQQYEQWLCKIEQVRKPGRVLDIGCGTGLFLSVARRRGWQPFGVDESLEATDHARNHFGLDPWVGEFESFVGTGEQFDLVTGWDVIEHSRDPVSLLRDVRRCLTPDGMLGLSTPNQRSILDLVAGFMYRATGGRLTAPLEKFYIDQHFLYFSPDTLRSALARAGLEITRMDLELTDLRRLSVSPLVRAGLEAMFLASRLLGRQNRLFIMARAGN